MRVDSHANRQKKKKKKRPEIGVTCQSGAVLSCHVQKRAFSSVCSARFFHVPAQRWAAPFFVRSIDSPPRLHAQTRPPLLPSLPLYHYQPPYLPAMNYGQPRRQKSVLEAYIGTLIQPPPLRDEATVVHLPCPSCAHNLHIFPFIRPLCFFLYIYSYRASMRPHTLRARYGAELGNLRCHQREATKHASPTALFLPKKELNEGRDN